MPENRSPESRTPNAAQQQPPLLRNTSFIRLWAVGWVTGIMMWLEMLVIALLALELTDSPFLVSVTFFLRFIPMIFGFGIGVVADRLNRKHIMTVGLVIQAATSAALAYLVITNAIEYWHLALGSFLIGAVMASEFPVRRTMMAEVVGRNSAGRAVSLEFTTNSLFRIMGPFIGGLFLVTIGPQGGFLMGLALYSTGALISLTLKYRQPTSEQEIAGPRTQVIEAVRYIRRSDVMIGTLIVTLVLNVFGFSYMSQQPIIARQVLMVSDVFIGLLQSVEGAGAFLGSALVAALAHPRHYTRIFMFGSMLYLVTIVLFSLSTAYWVSLAILFVAGFGMAGFATMQSAIMMYVSSPEMRGRVLGSIAMFIGIGPFGQLGIGLLADSLGPTIAVRIVASIGIVMMLASFVAFPIMRSSNDLEQPTS